VKRKFNVIYEIGSTKFLAERDIGMSAYDYRNKKYI